MLLKDKKILIMGIRNKWSIAFGIAQSTRTAKEIDMLNEHSSIVTLTYHGSTKVINGYNVMGV